MIDSRNERLLTFQEAVKLLPRKRQGKTPSPSTLYRWSTNGLYGVRLETLCVGGSRCTSAEALQRFFERLTRESVEVASRDQKSENAFRQTDAWGDDGR